MRFLVIIAHGSRREQSNEEIRVLAQEIGNHSDNNYDGTLYAFLELSEPSISNAIDSCISQGATSIVVLPYFLSRGNHVARDIPEILEQKRRQYPELNLDMKDYIGNVPGMLDLVVQSSI